MNTTKWMILVASIAVLLDIYFIWAWRRYRALNQGKQSFPEHPFLKACVPKPFMNLILRWKKFISPSTRENIDHRVWWKPVLEIFILLIWAMWIGRDYLNLNSHIVPAGREFGSVVQANHLWTRFETCGWCALWDGSERGGFPAFVDPYASALNPIVIITTLIFGVVNGVKVALIIALWIAGIAQWWLGDALKLKTIPRMWGAMMVMVAGHLAGRMELGVFSMVLSTAIGSLTFASAILLTKTGEKRYVVWFAVILALFATAGQGYMQIGWLLTLPVYLILIFNPQGKAKAIWKKFSIALGLGALLAAPFLVPFLHFFPNLIKDFDPAFKSGQPLGYYLLNLLIDDHHFYLTTELGKLPYPYLYTMYIGWIPLLLALLTVRFHSKEDSPWLWFMATTAGLALFIGSTMPLRWLHPLIPGLGALRYAPVIGGLAITPLIALAAYALDKLLVLNYPELKLFATKTLQRPVFIFSLKWLWLVPLLLALRSGYNFSQEWLYTRPIDHEVYRLLENLKTPSLAWVEPPFGEHFYIEPAVSMGLKLSPGIMPWRWRERDFPNPSLEAKRDEPPPGDIKHIATINGVAIYAHADTPYAAVVQGEEQSICQSSGLGGRLNVVCDSPYSSGTLTLRENTWSGWFAWVDGEPTQLIGEKWLETTALPGKRTYRFEYRPWDVPLGIFFMLLGLTFSIGYL
ncbi:MAG: hypothetical protein J7L73_07735, partial [Anaerolineales bacterium]|nr:hypothetical protein [Anaerolineales bacterium]